MVVGHAAGGIPLQASQMIVIYVILAAIAETELMQGGAEMKTVTRGGTTTWTGAEPLAVISGG